MEKWGSVGQRVVRLPPGFRFHPTDEELVQQYLLRKAFGFPLPAAIIPEIELAKYDPWDLPGSTDKEKYFFSIRQAKYPNGSRSNRASASGYWKATGKDKQIAAPRSGQVIGMKKVLVFYGGKALSGCKTDWIMHEYRLAAACAKACIFPQRKNSNPISTEDWVLCRIFRKRRAGDDGTDGEQAGQEEAAVTRRRLIDFMGRADAESRSSSDSESSCVTDVLEGRTEDGSCNSASSSTGGEQRL